MLDYWHKMHAQNSDWAFRAYAKLVDTLSADVQEKLRGNKMAVQPYIAIFGKTQVGKTTLLLDLLGIDSARMPTVSRVMRGGRETGKSATATTMEYCRSETERWGLELHGEARWFDADVDMEQALGQLRAEMEIGLLVAETPCVVHIPQRYFGAAASTAPDVRILDLPGDKPANDQEQSHVNQMAKVYLPFADLILLVGRGDDLGFVQPGAITLPGIEDWQIMPHRFRIVTTYSYSAQSVKDLIRNDASFDVSRLRQRLIEQIERFGPLSDATKDARHYFPLEFGSSWANVERTEPQLHERLVPIITALRKELLEQIASATTPMGRLRSTLNTHLSVRHINRMKIDAADKGISDISEKVELAAADVCAWVRLIEDERRKLSSHQEILKKNDLEKSKALIFQAVVVAAGNCVKACAITPKGDGLPEKDDCSILREWMRRYDAALASMELDTVVESNPELASSYWRTVRRVAIPPEACAVQEELEKAFRAIRRKVTGYTFDMYVFSSNYREDLAAVHKAAVAATSSLITLWRDAWWRSLADVHKTLQCELGKAQAQLQLDEYELKKAMEKKERFSLQLAWCRAERERIEEVAREDLERCDKLIHFLDEEYLFGLRGRMHCALQDEDECDAFLQVLSCVELKNQREDLMNLNEKPAN